MMRRLVLASVVVIASAWVAQAQDAVGPLDSCQLLERGIVRAAPCIARQYRRDAAERERLARDMDNSSVSYMFLEASRWNKRAADSYNDIADAVEAFADRRNHEELGELEAEEQFINFARRKMKSVPY